MRCQVDKKYEVQVGLTYPCHASLDRYQQASQWLTQGRLWWYQKETEKHDFEFVNIKALLNKVLGQNQTSLLDNIDYSKDQDPTNVV